MKNVYAIYRTGFFGFKCSLPQGLMMKKKVRKTHLF